MQTPILRESGMFLIRIILHQLRKQLSRILRFQTQDKFEDIWLVLTIQTVTPVGFCFLTFACENKQGNHCNWHIPFKERVSEKFSIIYPLLNEEKTLAVLVPLTLLLKNHNLFANIEKDEKKGGKKKNDRAHPLIMQMCNTRGGGGGGGGCVKREGGGGGGPFTLRLYMSQVICSNMTICETHTPC
jgi:hypothetical protein